MTGKELVDVLRESHLNDIAIPHLWEDPELIRYLNDAEDEACRRAHLLIDRSTANDSGTAGTASTMGQQPLCTLPLVVYQANYTLSRKIIQVKRCQLSYMTNPLIGPVSYPELDDIIPGWMGTAGSVGYSDCPIACLNEPVNTLTIVPATSTSGTAYLVVSRLPLVKFTLETSPEIEDKYHRQLCDWAAHLAFLKNDSDAYNPDLAKFYEERFEKNFGPMPSAKAARISKTLSMRQRMRPREFGS